jgi:hypothetical protein
MHKPRNTGALAFKRSIDLAPEGPNRYRLKTKEMSLEGVEISYQDFGTRGQIFPNAPRRQTDDSSD